MSGTKTHRLRRGVRLALCLLALPAVDVRAAPPAAEQSTQPVTESRIRYTVERGDTLSEIARVCGVTVSDLRRWNNLEGDFIRDGQELTVHTSRRRCRPNRRSSRRQGRGRVRYTYVVQRGDTLSEIARRHGLTTANVIRWNRRIDPDRIRAGQEIRIYLDDRPGRSSSVGSPDRGRLSISRPLRAGPGYRVRTPSRAFGTSETVNLVQTTLARFHQRFPNAPTLVIGDLSYESGGRMRPHASHQSGRDADIAYYTLGRDADDGFIVATAQNLDVQRTWYLFKSFIDTGAARYIFVDHALQDVLYEYARRRGASAQELDAWFQYPRREAQRGIIRPARGHDDHFHIRFRCPSRDRRCRD